MEPTSSSATIGGDSPLPLLSTVREAGGRRSHTLGDDQGRNALEVCVVTPVLDTPSRDDSEAELGAPMERTSCGGDCGGYAIGPTVSVMLEGVMYDNQLRGVPLESAVAELMAFLAPPTDVPHPSEGMAVTQETIGLVKLDTSPAQWRLYVHVRDSLIQHIPTGGSTSFGLQASHDEVPPEAIVPYAWLLLTGLTLDVRFGQSRSEPPSSDASAAGATSVELVIHAAELFLGREATLRPALPVSAGPGATPLVVTIPAAGVDAGMPLSGLTGGQLDKARRSCKSFAIDGVSPLLLALRAQLQRSEAVRVAYATRLMVSWQLCGESTQSQITVSNDELHLETATDTTDALLCLSSDLGWGLGTPAPKSYESDVQEVMTAPSIV